MAHPLLGEKDSTPPPRCLRTAARIVAHEKGECLPSTQRSCPSLNDGPSLCANLLHHWWCWRALTAAISSFATSLNCADYHPVKIGDEQERLVTASPVMTKSRAPDGGKQLPGEWPRETAKTRHTSPQPSRCVRRKDAAPLSGAEEKTTRAISAHAQRACLLFKPIGSIK
jgi:hypothetical protein